VAYTGREASEAIADTYEGRPFNSPNDVIVARDGRVLFTDPYSTAMGGERGQPVNGVYAADPSGAVTLLYGEMGRPNGLAFSPDETILYVNDTDRQHILAFPMGADGAAGEPEVFATLDPAYGPGAPDGMKVDEAGNVFVTGPGGVWGLSPKGEPAAILHSPEFVGNFCFGGPENRAIYLTASTSVYVVRGLR
jgi:gluconolactonase